MTTSLFDHPTSQPVAAPAPAPATDPTSAASVLYGNKAEPVVDKTVSTEVQAARAADVGRQFYSTADMFKGTGLDEIEGLDHVAAAEAMRDLGADPSDARQLVTFAHQLPQATAEDHESWMANTEKLVSAADMKLARDFLNEPVNARVRTFIERLAGAEYHTATVQRVVQLARAAAIKRAGK